MPITSEHLEFVVLREDGGMILFTEHSSMSFDQDTTHEILRYVVKEKMKEKKK